jgi:hypothetical protein
MAKKQRRQTPANFLELAAKHLGKVQAARNGPDWGDLAMYGLYCLEALVRAATLKNGDKPHTTHWEKVNQAKTLAKAHGFPNIDKLMHLLNDMRKAEAYGDEEFDESSCDADDIADQIETYFDAVARFVKP